MTETSNQLTLMA